MQNVPATNVILEDIRSSHNVGSIFRTADALGISKIYLAGYTPAPKDKFGRINKEIAKTALGAEQSVAWEAVPDIFDLISSIKTEGKGRNQIVGVEQSDKAIDYKEYKKPDTKSTYFIFGNEVTGISKKVLEACDAVVEIPMKGQKESLNVSVSFGIALARILNL